MRTDVSPARLLALVAVLGVVAALIGYAIGGAGGADLAKERAIGTHRGHVRGAAVGRREGYTATFGPARQEAYDTSYRDTYRQTYLRGVQTGQ
ncbi:MAG: hypothetical protein QOJ14_923 [Thermoleophilaceae bacterium]|jgi:hypothetical protein|nr:hypothetical protein [Thermoleophilaceae bacterium]